MGDSEVSVISKVLKIYKRLMTYRPHLSDEAHRRLVQEKLQEIYQIPLLLEEVSVIIESHPELTPVRRPVAVRRKTSDDTWWTKRSPIEPQRSVQSRRGENLPTIDPSCPCSSAQDSEDALNCNFPDSNNVEVEDVAESTMPGPVIEGETNNGGEKTQQFQIYEVFQQEMPYNLIVKRGQVVLKIWTSPQFTYEQFPNENKKESLNASLNISVFDRLYAQRKQRNTKKPAKLHMDKRSDEKLKILQNRIQRLSANRFGTFSPETCININDENANSEDEILLIWLNDSAEPSRATKSAEADSDRETNFSLQNVYSMLEELTWRFNDHVSSCQSKDIHALQ